MHTREISIGGRKISIETGRMATQADGRIVISGNFAQAILRAGNADLDDDDLTTFDNNRRNELPAPMAPPPPPPPPAM